MNFETPEEIMADELEKQRRKLRDMNATLEKQYQMLRLIVQVSYPIKLRYEKIPSILKLQIHYIKIISENGN